MRFGIFSVFLLLSSSAFANAQFDLESIRYLQVKGSEGESSHVRCDADEAVVGFRHRNSRDECILGMWCEKAPFMVGEKERFLAVNRWSANFDIMCDADEYISGVNFVDDLDNSLEGIYCRKTKLRTLGNTYYVSLYRKQLSRSKYDGFCPNGGVATGIRFRESPFDDTTLGFYCSFKD